MSHSVLGEVVIDAKKQEDDSATISSWQRRCNVHTRRVAVAHDDAERCATGEEKFVMDEYHVVGRDVARPIADNY